MTDKDTIKYGLEQVKETIRTANAYTFASGGVCAMNMKRISNAIEFLNTIVPCKKCKHHTSPDGYMCYCTYLQRFVDDDWFCAGADEKRHFDI